MSLTNGSVLQEGQSASLRRHQSQCSICSHPQRQEIEEAWLGWANTTALADEFRLSRHALYRHMHVLGLFQERQKRVRRLYEKILERTDLTSFSGSDLLKALKGYVALCEKEETKQAASRPTQEVVDPVSAQEAAGSAESGSPLLEATSQPLLEGESVPPAEGNEQGAATRTPVASLAVQELEPSVANLVQ